MPRTCGRETTIALRHIAACSAHASPTLSSLLSPSQRGDLRVCEAVARQRLACLGLPSRLVVEGNTQVAASTVEMPGSARTTGDQLGGFAGWLVAQVVHLVDLSSRRRPPPGSRRQFWSPRAGRSVSIVARTAQAKATLAAPATASEQAVLTGSRDTFMRCLPEVTRLLTTTERKCREIAMLRRQQDLVNRTLTHSVVGEEVQGKRNRARLLGGPGWPGQRSIATFIKYERILCSVTHGNRWTTSAD